MFASYLKTLTVYMLFALYNSMELNMEELEAVTNELKTRGWL